MIRTLTEVLLRIWPVNRLLYAAWRHVPFPRGVRSRIIRTANHRFLVGVLALVRDEDGRVLLVRNTYDPGFSWSLPGGWMSREEQPEECIKREIREETGFEIEVVGLLAARTQRKIPNVDLIFDARVVSGSFRRSAEVTEATYFHCSQLPKGIAPGYRRIIAQLAPVAGSASEVDRE